MAATFPKFSDLPKELRLIIWNEALLGARETRTVVLEGGDRLWPMKHLISPLLLANAESRARAQAFYHVQLDIRPMAPDLVAWIDESSVRTLNRGDVSVGAGPRLLAGVHAKIRKYCHAVDWQVEWGGDPGQKMGKVYLSPEHDTLVHGYDIADLQDGGFEDQALGRDHVGTEFRPWHFISAEIPASARGRVCSLILATTGRFWFGQGLLRCEFLVGVIEDFVWQAERFPNACVHYLTPWGEPKKHVRKIMESGGRLPYIPEGWARDQGVHGEGIFARTRLRPITLWEGMFRQFPVNATGHLI